MKTKKSVKLVILSIAFCLSMLGIVFSSSYSAKAAEQTDRQTLYTQTIDFMNKSNGIETLTATQLEEINALDEYTLSMVKSKGPYNKTIGAYDYGYSYFFSDGSTYVANGGTLEKAVQGLYKYVSQNELSTTFRVTFPENAWLQQNFQIASGFKVYVVNQSFSAIETNSQVFRNDFLSDPEYQRFTYGNTGKFYAPSRTFTVLEGGELYLYNCAFDNVNGFNLGSIELYDTAGSVGGKLTLDKTWVSLANYETYLLDYGELGIVYSHNCYSVHKPSNFTNNGEVTLIDSSISVNETPITYAGRYGDVTLSERVEVLNYGEMTFLYSRAGGNLITNYNKICFVKSNVSEVKSYGYYFDALLGYFNTADSDVVINIDKFSSTYANKADLGGTFGWKEQQSFVYLAGISNDFVTDNGSITVNLSNNFMDGDTVCYYWGLSEEDKDSVKIQGGHIGKYYDSCEPKVEKVGGTGFYQYKTNGLYFFTIEGTEFLMLGDSSGDSLFTSERVAEHVKAENFPASEDITGFRYQDQNGYIVDITGTFLGHTHLTPIPIYKSHGVTLKGIPGYEGDYTLTSYSSYNMVGKHIEFPDNDMLDEFLGRENSANEISKYVKGWSLTEGGEPLPNNELLITQENYKNLTLYAVIDDKYEITFIEGDGSTYFKTYYAPGKVIEVSADLYAHYKKDYYNLVDIKFNLDNDVWDFYPNETVARANITVYPVYEPKTYILTLTGDYLSEIEGLDTTIEIPYGETVTAPEIVYNHRKVVNWLVYSGSRWIDYDFTALLTSNREIKAVWDAIEYDIDYQIEYPNGDEVEFTLLETVNKKYSIDNLSGEILLPTKADFVGKYNNAYKLLGFKINGACDVVTSFIVTSELLSFEGLTLVAVFETVELEVSLILSTSNRKIVYGDEFVGFTNLTDKAVTTLNYGDDMVELPYGINIEVQDKYGMVTTSVVKCWQLQNGVQISSLDYFVLVDYADNKKVELTPVLLDFAVKAIDEHGLSERFEWGFKPSITIKWEGLSTVKGFVFLFQNKTPTYLFSKTFTNYEGVITEEELGMPEVGSYTYVVMLYAGEIEEKDNYDYYSDFPGVHSDIIDRQILITKITVPTDFEVQYNFVYDGTSKRNAISLGDNEYCYIDYGTDNFTDAGSHSARAMVKDSAHYQFSIGTNYYFISVEIAPYKLEPVSNTIIVPVIFDTRDTVIDVHSFFNWPEGDWEQGLYYTDVTFMAKNMSLGPSSSEYLFSTGNGGCIINFSYGCEPKQFVFDVRVDGNYEVDPFEVIIDYRKKVFTLVPPEVTTFTYGEINQVDMLSLFKIMRYDEKGELVEYSYNVDGNCVTKYLRHEGYSDSCYYEGSVPVGNYVVSLEFSPFNSRSFGYEIEGGKIEIPIIVENAKVISPNKYFENTTLDREFEYRGDATNYEIYQTIKNFVDLHSEYLFINCWNFSDQDYENGIEIEIVIDNYSASWYNLEVQGPFTYENGNFHFKFGIKPTDFSVSVYMGSDEPVFDIEKPYEWIPEWDNDPNMAYIRDRISYSLTKNGVYSESVPEFTGSGKTIYFKVERVQEVWDGNEPSWKPVPYYNAYYGSFKDTIGDEGVKEEGVEEGGSQGGGSQGGSTGGTPGGSGEGGSASTGAGGCAGGVNTTNYTMMLMVFSALVVAAVKGIKRKSEIV